MEITEKVAYLKGLAEGMELDNEKKVGKLLYAVIDLLEDIALKLEDMDDTLEELDEGLDIVSDDLEDVENAVFGFDDGDSEDSEDSNYKTLDTLDEDEDCYATQCPNCEEMIYFDDSILEDGEILCPNCGEQLAFDLNELSSEEPETDPDRPTEENQPE